MPILHETSMNADASVQSRSDARLPAAVFMTTTLAVLLWACGPSASTLGGSDGTGRTSGYPMAGTSTTGDEFVDEELWRLSFEGTVRTTPPAGDALENVYVIATHDDPADPGGSERVSLFKINKEGEVCWKLGFGASSNNATLAVAPGGDIWTCIAGAVSRVGPDGTLRWTTSDSCTGSSSIAVGEEVSVSVHLRPNDSGGGGHVVEVVALDGAGARLWARDIGLRPEYEENVPYAATEVAGSALSETSVYVGCDTCSAMPALVELDISDGSVRRIGELEGPTWSNPRRTTFEQPRITNGAVWVDAYEDAIERRAWRWTAGSAAVAIDDSLPIEGEAGLIRRLYGLKEIQLAVDGMTRVVDIGTFETAGRAALQNGEPAALGTDSSVLMVSVPDPPLENPRARSCWEQACRVYAVGPGGEVFWVLDEDVVRIPYVGDGRLVYVAPNGDLVAHSAPLTPSAFGWGQWLGNSQGNSCRNCAGG